MDLNYSAEELAFRDQVRAWLRDHLPDDLRQKVSGYEELSRDDLLRWHRVLAEQGWVAPDWPLEWGGTGWNVVQRYLFEEELGYAAAPGLRAFGLRMCAPVLLRFGTEAQKQRFLPRIYRGDDFWCQGYSEPGSGSDLASLTAALPTKRCPHGSATSRASACRSASRQPSPSQRVCNVCQIPEQGEPLSVRPTHRSAAGASHASPGPLKRVVGRLLRRRQLRNPNALIDGARARLLRVYTGAPG